MTSDGNHLFVCDFYNDCVKVFEKKGTFLRQFGKYGSNDGEFRDPYFLAYHESELFVSEFANKRIQVVSVEGVFKRQFSLDFFPKGIAIWKQQCFVANEVGGSIHVFSKEGKVLHKWGNKGSARDQLQSLKVCVVTIRLSMLLIAVIIEYKCLTMRGSG